MRKIVIAAASTKFLSAVRNMLSQSGLKYDYICSSASEVMSLCPQTDNAVLICGPLKDAPSVYLAKTLPDTWDIILLLSSDQPFPYYVSNVIPLTLPISRKEFCETVISVLGSQAQAFGAKATAVKVRPEEEKELIEKAKRVIMKQRGITESDAHRLLQRYSMNCSITMAESARRFLSD